MLSVLKSCVGALAIAGAMGLAVTPVSAQATSQDAVLAVCSVVVPAQYEGENSRDGQCVAAVTQYLAALGTPSEAANPQLAALAVALAALYQERTVCITVETDLPPAMAAIAAASTDPEQKVAILQVRETLVACDVEVTAAIGAPESALNESLGSVGSEGSP